MDRPQWKRGRHAGIRLDPRGSSRGGRLRPMRSAPGL